MPRKRIEDIISSHPKDSSASGLERRNEPQARATFERHSAQRTAQLKSHNKSFFTPPRIAFSSDIWGGVQGWFRHPLLWGTTACGLIILVLSLLWLFEKATVKIFPAERTMDMKGDFTAFRGDEAKSKGATTPALSFETMESRAEATKTVKATEVEHVDRAASGAVVIYNNYSKANQRLITNTRLETPQGLVYRIHESVIVPGQKVLGGKVVPGSIEVLAYADEPGEKYNGGLTDFTIPGFKGLPQYKGFYVRSKTLMTGGFSGIVKTIPKPELEKIQTELEGTVTEKLLADAEVQKPKDFVLFKNAVRTAFTVAGDSGQQNIHEDTVSITETGNLRAVIFSKSELEKYLGKFLIPTLGPLERVSIPNIDALGFHFQDPGKIDLRSDTKISFSLEGNAHLVWSFDEEKVKTALAGKPKSDLATILAQFPSITRAEVTLRPFWKRSFPETPKDIEVQIITEK